MRLVSILVLVAACEFEALAEDWPQFRGPNRDGVSKETGLPVEWSASKNMVWKTPLPGPGSSSPIVFGDRVYVTCYTGYGTERASPPRIKLGPPGDLADLRRHLICVSRDSGEILWTREAVDPNATDPPYKDGNIALHGYASHTPCADEAGVYAYFGAAGAVAYSHGGERLWSARFGDNAKLHSYGSAASPLLYKNLLIINAYIEVAESYEQGLTVALDKKTGREVWREKVGGPWSSPALAAIDDKEELVTATWAGPWIGLDPATGKRLWQCEAKLSSSTPVSHEGVIYIMTNEGSCAVRAGGRGNVTSTRKLWESAGGPRISSPVFHDGHLYRSMDGHVSVCTDAKTGKIVRRERLGNGGDCYASPIVAEDRIYYVSRDNGTFVLAANPQQELLAQNKIDDDGSVFNGSPAVSGGRLYLRSDKRLYCIGGK